MRERDVTVYERRCPARGGAADPILIVGVLVGAAVVAAPAALRYWGIGGFVVVVSAMAAMLVVIGVLLHRPRRVAAWALVVVGCAIHVAANAVLLAAPSRTGTSGVGLPQAIAVLAYPALFVGILGITTRRPAAWSAEPSTAIASALIGTALIGLAVTLPEILRDALPLAEADWAGVMALGDFVLAMLVVRRVVGAAERNWSWWLLVAGFVSWGNAHAEVGTRIADGTFDGDSVIALTLVAGPLLVGVAALAPSMTEHPAPGSRADSNGEVVTSAWLVIVAPLLLVVVRVAQLDAARLWVVVPLVVLLAAAVARTASLVGNLDGPGTAWRGDAPTLGMETERDVCVDQSTGLADTPTTSPCVGRRAESAVPARGVQPASRARERRAARRPHIRAAPAGEDPPPPPTLPMAFAELLVAPLAASTGDESS